MVLFISTTQATVEVEFKKNFSNTEAEWKKKH